MATIEEEIILPLQRQLAAQVEFEVLYTQSAPSRFWRYFLIVSLSFMMSLGATSLFLLKNEIGKTWKQALSQFDWLVLAEGDQVAMDEVGRYLNKIDGVADTVYVSPEETYQNMKNDSALASDLALLNGNPFPSLWRVHWKPESFSAVKIQQALEDVKLFPGVVDVASDPKALQKIHLFRSYWYRIKLILSLMATAVIVFLSLFFGWLFFFSTRSAWPLKTAAFDFLAIVVSAAAGFALVYYLW